MPVVLQSSCERNMFVKWISLSYRNCHSISNHKKIITILIQFNPVVSNSQGKLKIVWDNRGSR